MHINRKLLAIIGRRIPAIYDVIPRGPQGATLGSHYSAVALNPQPLPPHELGAKVASELVRMAWLADRFGIERSDVLKELDDWCPTQPKKLKLPPGSGPIPEPEPHPDWFTDYQIGFVTRASMASAEFDGTRLGEYLGKAIDRTVAAMESPNMR
jgi:hypothetical protein